MDAVPRPARSGDDERGFLTFPYHAELFRRGAYHARVCRVCARMLVWHSEFLVCPTCDKHDMRLNDEDYEWLLEE